MVSYSIMTLVPNAFYYAPVLLPFALGNGLVAGRNFPERAFWLSPQHRLSKKLGSGTE